ncbi:hypothetical protein DYB32_007938 [Aphanomyces invadans]|uniref:CW-type domain-containing protein n=1 Tax=Aphanomyces invadans TaxID=157072 RepID=A0A3R7A501_9STRA|nr:hypothetical protein DYB32_007938 [Aphanomyces invadans]
MHAVSAGIPRHVLSAIRSVPRHSTPFKVHNFLGFKRLCSTRGLCHAHLSATDRPAALSSVVDDDKRAKKEHKKDKRDKKKKKKKDKKQKKDKKSTSVDDAPGNTDRSTAPPSISGLDSLLNPTQPGSLHQSVLSMPSVLNVPTAPLLLSPLSTTSSSTMPLFRPLQERAKSAVALGNLKPPPPAMEPVQASVKPPSPPPPPVEQSTPLPLNITIPTASVPDTDDAKALSARNKKKKKRKRVRAVVVTPTEEDAKWVQCDKCKKWRTVPEELDLTAMSNKAWYCPMNDWDVRYASCDVPEEVVEPKVKKAKIDDDNDDMEDFPATPKAMGGTAAPAALAQDTAQSQSSASASMSLASSTFTKSEPEKKEVKLTKKQRAKLKASQPRGQKAASAAGAVSSPGAKEIEWVQCDVKSCGKWRVVPSSIDISSLPIKWYCSLNTWAPSLANCSVRFIQNEISQLNKQVKAPELMPVLEWAQCEKCNKWRKLPAHVKSANLPDKWYCSLNHWNPAYDMHAMKCDVLMAAGHCRVASCSVPEETDQEHVPARAPIPIGPRPKRGKLCYRELLYAGNGQLRKESSTLSFEYEGKLYHRDDQYRNSSMYLAPSASGPPKPSADEVQDCTNAIDSTDSSAGLSQPEEDHLKYLLHGILKADTEQAGKSMLDLVAALHNDKAVVRHPPVYYSYATVARAVQAMVASGDMEEFRDDRLVTVTVPMQISSYASAYYVAGESNHENRTWKERHTGPHLLYRRRIQYKKPLKLAKPWKQQGFAGWGA